MKIKDLIEELKNHLKKGYTEIEFCGINGELFNLSDYASDENPKLVIYDMGTMEDNEEWNNSLN